MGRVLQPRDRVPLSWLAAPDPLGQPPQVVCSSTSFPLRVKRRLTLALTFTRSSTVVYARRHPPLAETPFEDGTFRLTLSFEETYPNKPPTVRFLSKMFHPNVYANGELCLDILQNRWSPTYDVAAILTSIQSLFNDPNPNSFVPTFIPRLALSFHRIH